MKSKTDEGVSVPLIAARAGKTTPALVLNRVSKRYTRRNLWRKSNSTTTDSLSEVCFTLHEGETLGLLGPNGAGKTTLLKIISTLIYPTSGSVSLYGRDIFENSIWARSLMGLVTCDERSFYWRLSGLQNLRFFSCLYGLPKKVAEERIQELLATLGLKEAAERPYGDYSSGMKQKMAITRGLLNDPRVALYDEPTRSLDPLSAQNIRKWILENRSRWPRQARILATNQLHEAELLCDRILILNRGRVIAHGTVREIRDRWDKRDYAMHRVTCAIPAREIHLRINLEKGLLSVEEEHLEEGARLFRLCARRNSGALSAALGELIQAGATVLRCETEQSPFDEVFCSLVMSEEAEA
jgi:ABC-2 type transport system ATP-binding protein